MAQMTDKGLCSHLTVFRSNLDKFKRKLETIMLRPDHLSADYFEHLEVDDGLDNDDVGQGAVAPEFLENEDEDDEEDIVDNEIRNNAADVGNNAVEVQILYLKKRITYKYTYIFVRSIARGMYLLGTVSLAVGAFQRCSRTMHHLERMSCNTVSKTAYFAQTCG